MENIEKLRVLLQHWIDHNKGHAEEFAKWQKLMADDAKGVVADHIGGAIKEMEQANEHLAKALHDAGGSKEGGGGDGGHHHHHGDGHHHH